MSVNIKTETNVSRLRYEARVAYLDGRKVRAKALNRKADQLERAARRAASKAVAGKLLGDVVSNANSLRRSALNPLIGGV